MKINNITLSDLRRMNGKEGLILQGCGGEIKEWMDGINKMLTDKGILLDNTKFENVSAFRNDGVTCINGFTQCHACVVQTTTRYAGVHKKLYKKITNRITIRMFKSIVKKKGDFNGK